MESAFRSDGIALQIVTENKSHLQVIVIPRTLRIQLCGVFQRDAFHYFTLFTDLLSLSTSIKILKPIPISDLT